MAKESKHVTKFKEAHLNPGETVAATALGYIGEAFGSKDNTQKNGALIVTDSRVAFYRKGLIGEILETIPLKSITSIERKKTLMHRTLRIHTSHDDLTFKTLEGDQEAAVVAAIEAGRSPSAAPTSAPESSLDKIKKLAELHDAGILSDDEYQTKKQALLAEV